VRVGGHAGAGVREGVGGEVDVGPSLVEDRARQPARRPAYELVVRRRLCAEGVVSGAMVNRSLLFTGVRVNSYSVLEGAVVLPYAQIERNARLNGVVIDRGVHIPAGLVVGEDPVLDARRFRRSDGGVCLITQPMIDAL